MQQGRSRSLPIHALDLPHDGNLKRTKISLLARGAEKLKNPRAEASAVTTLWLECGEADLADGFGVDAVPANLARSHCAGLEIALNRIWLPQESIVEAPQIAFHLAKEDVPATFKLQARGTRTFHIPLDEERKKVFIASGSDVVLPVEARNDTIRIFSQDRSADLSFCGRLVRRPFFARHQWDHSVAHLQEDAGNNDLVEIIWQDETGFEHRKVLFRALIRDEVPEPEIFETDGKLAIEIPVTENATALEVTIHVPKGPRQFTVSLDHRPSKTRPPSWITDTADISSVTLLIDLDGANPGDLPSLITAKSVDPNESTRALQDAQGLPHAIYLSDIYLSDHGQNLSHQQARHIVKIASTSVSEASHSTFSSTLQSDLVRARETVSPSGQLTPLVMMLNEPALTLEDFHSANIVPNLDVLHFFGSLLEAPPHVLGSLTGRLAPLGRVPDIAKEITDATESLGDWLERTAPGSRQESYISHAFNCFRAVIENDPNKLMSKSKSGRVLEDVLATCAEDLKQAVRYDRRAKGDLKGARLGQFFDRLARAAVQKETEIFIKKVQQRTGWPHAEVTRAISLAIYTAPDLLTLMMARVSTSSEPRVISSTNARRPLT